MEITKHQEQILNYILSEYWSNKTGSYALNDQGTGNINNLSLSDKIIIVKTIMPKNIK